MFIILSRQQEATKIKKAAEDMASEIHMLNDESDGLKKRVEYTAERLNKVEVQFVKDQESINDVNNIDETIFVVLNRKLTVSNRYSL